MRKGATIVYAGLKSTGCPGFHLVKDLLLRRKQKDKTVVNQYSLFPQSDQLSNYSLKAQLRFSKNKQKTRDRERKTNFD